MFNFEIKTKILSKSKILKKIMNLGAVYKGKMNQTDYYLKVGVFKKKVREIDQKTLQLISYRRFEKMGRKNSCYSIKKLSLNQKNAILKQNPILCVVNKTRDLWIYKNTRIHLDKINNLGNYLELETVVKGMSKKRGINEFNEITNFLNITSNKTKALSYSDLVLNKNVSKHPHLI